MPASISATLHTDPGCPWAYSALPALRVLDWRYGDEIDWRLVVIGLREKPVEHVAAGHAGDRRVGPDRLPRALRHAVRARSPSRAWPPPRGPAARSSRPGWTSRAASGACCGALQLANFTSPLLLDDDALLAAALRSVPGLDADALVARIDDPDVTERLRARPRRGPHGGRLARLLQGKTANTDGPSATRRPRWCWRPAVGAWRPAGGSRWRRTTSWSPTWIRACAASRPPTIRSRCSRRYPEGLTTQEVAALLVRGNDALDRTGAEIALQRLVAEGRATKTSLGHDAIWTIAGTHAPGPRRRGQRSRSSAVSVWVI